MNPAVARKGAGVAGWPVAHSLSPALHTAWIAAAGLNADYFPIEVAPEDAARFFAELPTSGLVGVNVTAPHKETALKAARAATSAAQRIGAANLLTVRDGEVVADNTDAKGFAAAIRQGGGDPCAKTLILGAGGAARAIVAALIERGSTQIVIANRTRENAERIASGHGASTVSVVDWDARDRAVSDAELIVNATTLGMRGAPELELDLSSANAGAVVFDSVYAPLETSLLAQAKARGLTVVDGLDMLIEQARPSFEAFFGAPPPADVDARAVLLAEMEARA